MSDETREPSTPLGEPAESEQNAARQAVDAMVQAGLLDRVLAQADSGELRLTGEGGFLPEMVKRVLEAGLQAELTDHLGYDRHDRGGPGVGEFAERVDGENGWAPRSATSTWLLRGTATAPSSRNWSARASGALMDSVT